MKKIPIISFIIILLLLALIISGVMTGWFQLIPQHSDENHKNYSFIGTWEVNHSWYENGTKIDAWSYIMTFYSNGTSKIESENHSRISWEPYLVKNNQICYENQGNDICYTITYADDGNKMILTTKITNQYGEIVIIKNCKKI